MSSPIIQAMQQICDEKNIPFEAVLQTIEAALAAAYRKDFGERDQNIFVKFDPENGQVRAFDVKTVVEDMELEEVAPGAEPKEAKGPTVVTEAGSASVIGEEIKPKFNPKTMVMQTPAQGLKSGSEVGEIIETELPVPGAFGRMAAQTAKQVITQKLREVERGLIYNEYKSKEKDVITVTVQRREGRVVLVDMGRATGVMLPEDQVERERYVPGERLKVLLKEVNLTSKGPELLVSRSHPDLVLRLFQLEIPEVASGTVEIKGIAREGGSRSKVAVVSKDENIDPIGSCIGQRGGRIQTIIAELAGEKIDVIQWSEDPKEFIRHSLAPAKATSVELKPAEQTAMVTVPVDQLSLAIGKGGQNVRLAAKLTGWKINVKGEDGVVAGGSEAISESEAPVVEAVAEETAQE
ncbi:MAG: transcription termination factor NusA [bacterium]